MISFQFLSMPVQTRRVCQLLVGTMLMTNVVIAAGSPRERVLMDAGWKFYLGDDFGAGENLAKAGINKGPADPTLCDAAWRVVNLPHDWVNELSFDPKADRSHGFKPVGKNFTSNSIGWYRRTFVLPEADAGKRLRLEFDGVYRDCVVFVNGYRLGRHESGYGGFRFDITDVARIGGDNVVAVRVDATKFEGWFYEGAGIYRHVWLEKTAPVAIAPDGVFVYSSFPTDVPAGPAKIFLEARLLNSGSNAAAAKIDWKIFAPDGVVVATANGAAQVNAGDDAVIRQTTDVAAPALWSPESPRLYKLVTTVECDGKIVDRLETEFGIRTFVFDPDRGFLLNGRPYVIKGTCNHQDHAGVGAALPDALQYFRIARLKEMGDNAYRTSHNPPTPELLEACDRLGMLVMDENRLLGSSAENLELLEQLVRRDRNHAGVFIWSIANEEHVQASPAGARVAETMQRLIHRLDPTRPVTCAVSLGDVFDGIDGVMDVRGWNYHLGPDIDLYHQKHPHQPGIGSEQASTVTTRGIYTNDAERGYVSAYDAEPRAGQSAESWWSFFAERPWLSGGFAWTGFDYRGEPTPYGWPCISSHFGIMDTCGFPKDNFYYYQTWWSDKIVLHLLPHWNWPGREGQEIDVRAFSNCQEVELFLNSKSLGSQTPKRNSHLEWKVPYAPGILSAKGYNDGRLVAQTKVETTGAPAGVQLTPDRSVIKADGADLSIITVSVNDARGRMVPTANDLIHFELNGPGKIIGVGNGDPGCHEPDVYLDQPATRSGTMNLWWMNTVSNTPEHREVAEKFNETRWGQTDVSGAAENIKAGEVGVFRAHLFLPDADLALTNIVIRFGSIKGEGSIYVNGQPAGESHGVMAAPAFNVRNFLHVGINTIAVLVHCPKTAGGLGDGVCVELPGEPVAAHWRRSVFNGLAQIIVQSAREPGQIKLTASADSLSPASLTVTAQPGVTRLAAH